MPPAITGDALAAAFTWAMENKHDFADAVRWGVAAGTASAKLPGVSFASLQQIEEIQPAVAAKTAKPKPAPIPKPEAANKCPHCGAEFPKPMKFCGECGKAMS